MKPVALDAEQAVARPLEVEARIKVARSTRLFEARRNKPLVAHEQKQSAGVGLDRRYAGDRHAFAHLALGEPSRRRRRQLCEYRRANRRVAWGNTDCHSLLDPDLARYRLSRGMDGHLPLRRCIAPQWQGPFARRGRCNLTSEGRDEEREWREKG